MRKIYLVHTLQRVCIYTAPSKMPRDTQGDLFPGEISLNDAHQTVYNIFPPWIYLLKNVPWVVTEKPEVFGIETEELLQDLRGKGGVVGDQEVLRLALPLVRVHHQQARVHVALHAALSAVRTGMRIRILLLMTMMITITNT